MRIRSAVQVSVVKRARGALIHLPAYEVADVVVDPTRGFGQPIFAHGGVRVEDAMGMFRADEPLDVAAEE